MWSRKFLLWWGIYIISIVVSNKAQAQCGSLIMEPGFQFLTSSRGCAPFTVQIETLYLLSTAGTQYFVDWGDGTAEEVFTQLNATGVVIQHTYPNSPTDCGYDITIDASNGCNPRGSVVPVNTQVVVWTNDMVAIAPGTLRVCQGYATSFSFADNSDWNCYPRATRENNESRWIQWIYGTGSAANRIPGIQVNGVTPGAYPYLNPAPLTNPYFPITAPGQTSLSIDVPATAPADVGKQFQITLNNWNQCNPYDNVLTDGNGLNPVSGDLVNGDNAPQVNTARVVIVESPEPQFVTRLNDASGPIRSVFCVGEDIYFDDETPTIAGANFAYTWEFYDNATGTGTPLGTSTAANPTYNYTTSGQKLIRLYVRDTYAAGNCEAVVETTINISPSLEAHIGVTDLAGNPIGTDFCQQASAPLTTFEARFTDVSIGSAIATTEWRWEFYDQTNALVFEAPTGGSYSATALGPFNRSFVNLGVYRVVLRIRDNVTFCESIDEVQLQVLEKPVPNFTFTSACEGDNITFTDQSTLNATAGEQIVSWAWDMDYDGTTFTPELSLNNQQTFDYDLGVAATYQVALQVTTDGAACADTAIRSVIVDPLPLAAITADVTSGCSILTVNFTNTAVGSQPVTIDQYIWEIDWGQGAGFETDSIQHPTDPGFGAVYTKAFTNTGNTNLDITVRLRAVSTNGCERISNELPITIEPGPTAGFISSNYSPFNDNCTPQAVDFTVDAETQAFNPSDYTWTIEDNNGVIDQISTGTTPAFSYTFENNTQLVKNFTVSLRATLPSTCYADSLRTIRISPVPPADFAIDTLLYNCEEMNLRFEAGQTGLSEYAWTIRVNGTTIVSTTGTNNFLEQNFTRLLTGHQAVVVSLVTRNLLNCPSAAVIENITVPQSDNLTASFTATPLTQTLPDATVTLTNTSSAGAWNYLWDFGDGQTSTEANVGQHTYASYGTYTITLTVSNDECSAQAVTTVVINAIPPVLDFEYDPAQGCAPLTVHFTNLSQYADEGTYHWQFGNDQGTSNAINPSYTYNEPGLYSVTLTASNVTGEVSELTKHLIIEVFEKPSARFNLKPSIVYVPGGTLYTDNQSFGASHYLWDFGDGSTATAYEPDHTYQTEGVFDVTLVAYNEYDCTDTATVAGAVLAQKGGELLIPNAFSPNLMGPGNTSGQNDAFLPLVRGLSEFQMLIYNRWGELLFETKDPQQGWDGYYKGKLCPQDVYVYKIMATFEDGNVITRMGDVNLLR